MSLTKVRRRVPFIQNGWPSWLEANELFNDDFFTKNRELPAMNIKDLGKNIEIELAIPGFSKDQIEVTVENEQLHVVAKNEKESVEENLEGYTQKEFSSNLMERFIPLPEMVNPHAEIKANCKNGLLKIDLEKLELPLKEQVKKVAIH